MLIIARQMAEILALKSKMAKVFDLKDMGKVGHILGICIKRDRSKKRLWLSQEEYINKVLQHFNMIGGKALIAPLTSYVKLSKLNYPDFEGSNGEIAVCIYICGSLMYAMIATCLDIAFSMGVVSKSW